MKKKILTLSAILIFAICSLFFCISASAEIYSGNCGAYGDVTYKLDTSTGVLEITGTGDMTNYGYLGAPWDSYSGYVKTVKISDSVTSIGNWAFHNCSSLSSVTIPDSVTSIGDWAFHNCSSLDSVTIPNGVTSIGKYAFEDCSYLISVSIGNDVINIGVGVFSGCNNLKAIEVDENNSKYCDIDGVLFTKDTKTLVVYPCDGSKIYSIPDSVTSIGDNAFSFCKSLTSVTIPDSVTSIGEYSFYSCKSLTSIIISDSVTSVGRGAFLYTAYYMDELNWKDNVLCIDNHCISAKSNILGSYSIEKGIKTIADFAFENCINLTEVIIPDSVVSIGDEAFSRCSSLICAVIPDTVISIGAMAFFNCSSLSNVSIPGSVTSIGYGAFSGCNNLKEIKISESNLNFCDIYGVAFTKNKETLVSYPCGGDKTYTFPDSVKNVGASAFSCCSNLVSVNFTNRIISIDTGAFEYCSGLTGVIIPDSVTSISDYAFTSCNNLTSISFKSRNTDISNKAFYGCDNLETIYLYKNSTADEYFSDEEYTKIYLDDIEFGDASGDNVINAKDMVLLAKSFTDWDVEIDKTAADCNLDGVFDIKDLVLLTQYLAGWNVTLG